MGTYTMRIEEIIRWLNGNQIISGWQNKIESARKQIFDFDYPMYGVNSEEIEYNRVSFEKAFLNAFLMREIGFETFELWVLKLEGKLNLIMPRYVELYKTTLFELDLDNPLHLITTHDQDTTDTGSTNEKGESNDKNVVTQNVDNTNSGGSDKVVTNDLKSVSDGSKSGSTDTDNMFSDFPNSSFGVGSGDYATNRTQENVHSSDTTKTTQTDTGNVKEDYDENYKSVMDSKEEGSSDRSFANTSTKDLKGTLDYIHDVKGHTKNTEILDAVEKWRKLIININEMIIKELADLFMMIYN